jgi:hypothetical protein
MECDFPGTPVFGVGSISGNLLAGFLEASNAYPGRREARAGIAAVPEVLREREKITRPAGSV